MPYLSSHRGDYLAAHQGGIGSFLRRAAGGVLKTAGRFLGLSTPAGIAASAAIGTAAPAIVRQIPPAIRGPGGLVFRPGQVIPGGRPFITRTPDVIPKGYRLNKTSYFTKSEGFVPEGTKLVKIRRRNFANGRALRRAITRTQGFNRLVKSSRKSLRELSRI